MRNTEAGALSPVSKADSPSEQARPNGRAPSADGRGAAMRPRRSDDGTKADMFKRAPHYSDRELCGADLIQGDCEQALSSLDKGNLQLIRVKGVRNGIAETVVPGN